MAKVGGAKPFTAADRLAKTGSIEVLKQGSRWQEVREVYLKANPLCVFCKDYLSKLTPATVVDHIEPHRNNSDRFWDQSNWQPLCYHCHNSYKQRHEKSGIYGCDANGLPLDPSSHWN